MLGMYKNKFIKRSNNTNLSYYYLFLNQCYIDTYNSLINLKRIENTSIQHEKNNNENYTYFYCLQLSKIKYVRVFYDYIQQYNNGRRNESFRNYMVNHLIKLLTNNFMLKYTCFNLGHIVAETNKLTKRVTELFSIINVEGITDIITILTSYNWINSRPFAFLQNQYNKDKSINKYYKDFMDKWKGYEKYFGMYKYELELLLINKIFEFGNIEPMDENTLFSLRKVKDKPSYFYINTAVVNAYENLGYNVKQITYHLLIEDMKNKGIPTELLYKEDYQDV